jgi:hypothetical protein
MSFTVVYDANVLFPAPLRDLLVVLAHPAQLPERFAPRSIPFRLELEQVGLPKSPIHEIKPLFQE